MKNGRYTTRCFILNAIVCYHTSCLVKYSSNGHYWSVAIYLVVSFSSELNSSQVDDPTIQQPQFDLPQHQLSLTNCCQINQSTVQPVAKTVVLQRLTSVLVANDKQCCTLSAAVHRPSWRVICSSFTSLTMLLMAYG